MNVKEFLEDGVRRRGEVYVNIHTGGVLPKEFVEKFAKMYGIKIKEER